MDLRKSGSRDDRRRRVLMDEAQAEPALVEDTPPAKKTKAKSEERASSASRYSSMAVAASQPRITDLLPKRRLTLSLWWLALACVIAALAALDVLGAGWKTRFPQVDWSWTALHARGNLGSWVAALELAWAAFAAMQIYLIRRHRVDDYRGAYRLWTWAAGGLALASADVVTSAHATAGALLASLAHAPQHGEVLGLALVAFTAGAFGLRMIWEILPSRGALAFSALAAAAYLTAALATAGALEPAPIAPAILGPIAVLCGHALVVLAVGAFGRYVSLEAQGDLAKRPRKTKPPRTGDAATKRAAKSIKSDTAKNGEAATSSTEQKRSAKTDLEGENTRTNLSSPSTTTGDRRPAEPPKKPSDNKSPLAATRTTLGSKTTSGATDDGDDEGDDDSPALSKAERRRQRKQQRNNQRAA